MLKPDQVFLVTAPIDMHQGIDRLTQYITTSLDQSWHAQAAFIFCNKNRTRIKVLRWDQHGVWLCQRRLHKGSFPWPRHGDTTWSLTQTQFNWLVQGIDWQKIMGIDLHKITL